MIAKAVCRIGVVERRFFSSFISFVPGKWRWKSPKAALDAPAELIDRLIGIADSEHIALFFRQHSQNFDLGIVGILKFIHQNIAAVCLGFPQLLRVLPTLRKRR